MTAVASLTPAELVARWKSRVTTRTLANWRCMKPRRGPGFVRQFGRVSYPLAQVEAWEKEQGISHD